MSKSNINNTIIGFKCLIFIFGFFSLITPWLFFPNFYEMNFLGFIKYSGGNKLYMEPEFRLLFVFGSCYLIGFLSNIGFYESNKNYTYYIGIISSILTIFGMFGYLVSGIMLVAYTSIIENRDIVNFGLGFYLALFVTLLIIAEFIYFKIYKSNPSKKFNSEHIITTQQENEKKLLCPNCNAEIIDQTSAFCNRCGSPLN